MSNDLQRGGDDASLSSKDELVTSKDDTVMVSNPLSKDESQSVADVDFVDGGESFDPGSKPPINPMDSYDLGSERSVHEFVIEGNSLFFLSPENPLRILIFRAMHTHVVENFILCCIMVNTATLMFQTPGNPAGLSSETNVALNLLDLVISIIFTVEALLRIIALGFVVGEHTYLRNAWNVMDFILLLSTWMSLMVYRGLEAPMKPNVFRTMRALRPLRSLRFFAGLRAIVGFLPFILNVLVFLLFFMSLFGVVGIQLFGGILSRRCVASGYAPKNVTHMTLLGSAAMTDAWPGTQNSSLALPTSEDFVLVMDVSEQLSSDCPYNLGCEGLCTVMPFGKSDKGGPVTYAGDDANGDNYPDDCDGYYCYRNVNYGFFGFDDIWGALLTEVSVVMMDEWPMFAHALAANDPSTGFLVWPFFAVAVFVLSVVTAKLFISVVCNAFGNAKIIDSDAVISARTQKLLALFQRIDTDGGGTIDVHEIAQVAKILNVALSPAEVTTAVEEMDDDNSGDVDFSEFCTWWRSESPIALRLRRSMAAEDGKVQGCFDRIDEDASGELDLEELFSLFKDLGIILSEPEMVAVLAELDEDGDGVITFDEFCVFWYSGAAMACEVRNQVNHESDHIRAIFDKLDVTPEVDAVDTKTESEDVFASSFGDAKTAAKKKGTLNSAEVTKLPSVWGDRDLDPVMTRAIVKEMDMDASTSAVRITFEEFFAWWKSDISNAVLLRNQYLEAEARVRAIFNRVDADGSGMLDREELEQIAENVGLELDIDAAIAEIDEDESGEFDFEEFFGWFFSDSAHAKQMNQHLPTLMMREAEHSFPNVPCFTPLCKTLVTHHRFEDVMMVVIITNVVAMSCEYYGMPKWERDLLFYSEILFAIIYVLECIAKICGIGITRYFKSDMNKMDFTIAAVAVVGLTIPDIESVNSIRVFRVLVKVLRLLRTVKLLSRYDAVVLLLRTVVGSSDLLLILTLFIMFMLGIASIVAVHSIGACHVPGHSNDDTYAFNSSGFPRRNFYTFGEAFISNFQIMSGAGTSDLMFTYMNCAGQASWIYFVVVYALSNFFLLNIFIAVVLENFSLSEEEKLIKQEERYLLNKDTVLSACMQKNTALDWIRERQAQIKEMPGGGTLSTVGMPLASIIRKGMSLTRLPTFRKNKMKSWNKTEGEVDETAQETRNNIALGCLGPDNPLRRGCKQLTESKLFEHGILFMILASSVALAIEGPPNARYLEGKDTIKFVLATVQTVAIVVFWFEFGVKVIASGFLFTVQPYLLDGWNQLDFFVLISSTVDIVMTTADFKGTGATRVMRLLRVLRPLRMIQQAEGMRVVVDTLIVCFPTAGAVMALSGIFYISFALLGVSFFGGKFYRCSESSFPGAKDSYLLSEQQCCAPELHCTTAPSSSGRQWLNPGWNFDNVLSAIRQLFLISTSSGWIDIMHSGMDVTEYGMPPIRNNNFYMCMFFILFIILGGFFINSIFIGVLVNFFGESSGTSLLTRSQKRWLQTQMLCLSVPSRVPPAPAEGSPRVFCHKVVNWKHFDDVSIILILVNLVLLMCEEFPQSDEVATVLWIINTLFLVAFTVEWIFRALAHDFVDHWNDPWAKFDLVILTLSWLSTVLESFDAIQAFRALRALRISMLVKKIQSLRTLVSTLMRSVPPALNLSALMTLVLFVFGVLGMELLGETPHGTFVNANDNFDDMLHATKYLFQIMTGQEFHYTMAEYSKHERHNANMVFLFYASFYISSVWIYMNLFVAVILENFEAMFVGGDIELCDDDIQQFKDIFVQYSEAPNHEQIKASDLDQVMSNLEDSTLNEIMAKDVHWHNRLLFELQIEPDALDDSTVGFYELLLVLCLIHETYDGLSFEEQTTRRERIRVKQEEFACRVVVQGVRRFLSMRHVPEEYKGRESVYKSAVHTVFILQVSLSTRRYKVLRARGKV